MSITVDELNTQINDFNKMYTAYTNCKAIKNCKSDGFDTTYGTSNKETRKALIDNSYNAIIDNIQLTITGAVNGNINGSNVFSSVANNNVKVFENSLSTDNYYSNYDNSYNFIINNNIKNIKSQKDLEMKIK